MGAKFEKFPFVSFGQKIEHCASLVSKNVVQCAGGKAGVREIGQPLVLVEVGRKESQVILSNFCFRSCIYFNFTPLVFHRILPGIHRSVSADNVDARVCESYFAMDIVCYQL